MHPEMQFSDLGQQQEIARLGIWVFLATEILFFGGPLLLYTVYRGAYAQGFAAAARHTDILIGTANTFILLTSSFLVAWATEAIKKDDGRLTALLFGAAVFLGLVFLGLKGMEYSNEYHEQLIPGFGFAFAEAERNAALLFFTFYFITTILHAIHLMIGIVLLIVIARHAAKGRYGAGYNAPVFVSALYWHFIDLVWIVLFALIYLPGRSGP
ncbi:MAG TPA: cytochrome c oxidase subunit 3 [Micropepsaceae bacterium]